MADPSITRQEQAGLRKEMGLRDLVLAQVLCVVGSSWVGIAAKLGRAHVAYWLGAIALFYLPLAAVVIHFNRMMPLEGGLYQWAKAGFGRMAGFLIAWNLWVYALSATADVIFVLPTDLAYMLGPSAAWLPGSKWATLLLTGGAMLAIALVAVRGLDIGKWLHNIGSILIVTAYVILLGLPIWALTRGSITKYEPIPWQTPSVDWFGLAVFGQMAVGGLSGFEYVAIMAGECRSAARNIGQSVIISAPIIVLMFVLGTSSVLAFLHGPINVIGPIPQTMRAALGDSAPWAAQFGIFLVLARAVAAASLLFTGITRLPMTAGWDSIIPGWFTRLHPTYRTPVNSILVMALLVMAMILLSMLGVEEQEASQLLNAATIVHYAIAYIALFALPLFGAAALRAQAPWWLKWTAAAGLSASVVALVISVYPIVKVVSRGAYAAKVCVVVAVSNAAGLLIYRAGNRKRAI